MHKLNDECMVKDQLGKSNVARLMMKYASNVP